MAEESLHFHSRNSKENELNERDDELFFLFPCCHWTTSDVLTSTVCVGRFCFAIAFLSLFVALIEHLSRTQRINRRILIHISQLLHLENEIERRNRYVFTIRYLRARSRSFSTFVTFDSTNWFIQLWTATRRRSWIVKRTSSSWMSYQRTVNVLWRFSTVAKLIYNDLMMICHLMIDSYEA